MGDGAERARQLHPAPGRVLWSCREGASWLFPDQWERFLAPIPPAERGAT